MDKYKLKNGNILKDGHTMFLQDVVKDLNRKSYLEEEMLKNLPKAEHPEGSAADKTCCAKFMTPLFTIEKAPIRNDSLSITHKDGESTGITIEEFDKKFKALFYDVL